MKISIIGAGEIGSAIRFILKDKGFEILMWDKDENKVSPPQASLKDTIEGSEAVFLCIPSNFLRSVLQEISSFNIADSVIVAISKGMEASTNMTNIEVFEDQMPNHKKFLVLAGPMLSEEIVEGKVCGAVLASKHEYSLSKIEDIFKGTILKTQKSNNVLAVSTLGILKNVYAILCGISDGFENGNNTKSLILSLAVSEMKTVLEILFENGDDVIGLSGLGDLLTTSSGLFSKNFSFGFEMAKHGKSEIMSEGRISVPFFHNKLKDHLEKAPLLCAVKEIVEGKDVKATFEGLLRDI
jgi:glycerol-3-phosphate dehydrogenase (NAD(P)+)